MENSSEASSSIKRSANLNINEFKKKHMAKERPKQTLLSKARNVILAGLGIAGAGAVVEANIHPVEKAKEEVVHTAQDIGSMSEKLVDFYNEDPAIRQKSEEIAGKLNGAIPLSENEKIFEKIILVPAGANYEELQKMKDENALINVRNYPGTNTPDGRFSIIISRLPQGTIIENAILTEGKVPHPLNSNETAKWWGFVYKDPAKPNQPGKIGFIYGIYAEPTASDSSNTLESASQ